MANRRSHKATPARLLALRLTREARERDAYVRELVNAQRVSSSLSKEEFDFAQVLAYGVVMCVGTLDEALDLNLSSPRDVKPKVRDALRISAYELLFLNKPSNVAVDQGVELVRSVAPRATGLANAVLRKLAARAGDFPWGDPATDDAAFARKYGVPPWLATCLIAEFGREMAADILGACLQPAPRYLRANPFVPGESFASDLSAQQVAELIPLAGTILEIGAGRGTKTMLIESRAMEILGHTVPIHAVDLHEYKTRLHAERMRESGIEDVESLTGDALDLGAINGLREAYDCVFIDAPCSGTGTMRRHPEIRWRLSPSDIDELSSLQLGLLREAAQRVKSNGTLVYATCSILSRENRGVIESFLSLESASCWEWVERFENLPVSDGPDGHYAAVLRRVG